MQILSAAAEGAIERVTHNSDLPGQTRLGSISGFTEREGEKQKAIGERADIGCESEVRLGDAAHSCRGPAGEEGPDPKSIGRAEGAGTVGMQMVGDSARDELDSGLEDSASEIFRVPAHIDGGLAHGESGWKEAGLIIDDSFETLVASQFGCLPDPIISHFIGAVGNASGVEISAAPEPVGFGLQRLVDEGASNFRRWTVEAGDHKDAVGWMEDAGVGSAINPVLERTAQ